MIRSISDLSAQLEPMPKGLRRGCTRAGFSLARYSAGMSLDPNFSTRYELYVDHKRPFREQACARMVLDLLLSAAIFQNQPRRCLGNEASQIPDVNPKLEKVMSFDPSPCMTLRRVITPNFLQHRTSKKSRQRIRESTPYTGYQSRKVYLGKYSGRGQWPA